MWKPLCLTPFMHLTSRLSFVPGFVVAGAFGVTSPRGSSGRVGTQGPSRRLPSQAPGSSASRQSSVLLPRRRHVLKSGVRGRVPGRSFSCLLVVHSVEGLGPGKPVGDDPMAVTSPQNARHQLPGCLRHSWGGGGAGLCDSKYLSIHGKSGGGGGDWRFNKSVLIHDRPPLLNPFSVKTSELE